MVADSQNPLEWRYAAVPGLEVLSLCPDSTTEEFMRQFYDLRQLLELIIPPDLQLSQSVPVIHILGETDMSARLKQDVQVEMFQGQGTAKGAEPLGPMIGHGAPAPRVQVLPNLRLMDSDAYTVFALLDDLQVRNGQLVLTPDYVSFLLQRRTPPLPAWFVVGTMRTFSALTFQARSVEFGPLEWTSEEEARAIRKNPKSALDASSCPMEDLLIAPRPPEGPPEAVDQYRKIWIAQASLFTRWALDGRSPNERKAYFRFVDQASREPVTEAQLQDAFSLGFVALRGELARYLPLAFDKVVRLRRTVPLAPLDLKLRPAAPAETARIKGDWERMETGFVKKTYPALSGKYLDQARRTLHRAYDLGERDPRLLAVMGLTECDAGDDVAALPFLAAAVQGQALRPRAYYELARILYAQARAKPAGAQGKLGPAQTTAVVEPLLTIQRQSPPLAEACALFADLWFHTEASPLPSDLVQLNRDTRLFPRNYMLDYQTALLDAQAGDWPSTRDLVDRSLKTAAAPAVRARFAQLQALLPPAPPRAARRVRPVRVTGKRRRRLRAPPAAPRPGPPARPRRPAEAGAPADTPPPRPADGRRASGRWRN